MSNLHPAFSNNSGRFQPGVSGNPTGRPKKSQDELDLEVACKAKAPEAIKTLVEIMLNGSETNKLKAAIAILERGYGKPRQPIVGKDGNDLINQIEVTFIPATKYE
jgi:hypothetical protein